MSTALNLRQQPSVTTITCYIHEEGESPDDEGMLSVTEMTGFPSISVTGTPASESATMAVVLMMRSRGCAPNAVPDVSRTEITASDPT